MNKTLAQFRNGLFTQNPTLVLLLGMCPALAVSTTLLNGLGMGLCATLVLICSNTVISALRRLIPEKIRIAAYVVIIAGFVTAVEMLLGAYLPSLSKSLGLFIPLIVVNCIILARAEAFASKNGVARSALDGLTMGLGFTMSMGIISLIREVLGNGTLFSNGKPVGSADFTGLVLIPPDVFPPVLAIAMPMGGFLTLGFVIAAMQRIMSRRRKEGKA
ncbi:MAG: electron transport complex subunit E [Oscillospiraceae bacterium]|jgi:electron transport complex protein RnfE|nr:electron transport complex subunit E [Oscillospiraceae bacterium]